MRLTLRTFSWIWYETETLARQAHSVLHLATRPEDVGGNWYTAVRCAMSSLGALLLNYAPHLQLVGPPTFALTETDLNILLVTLQATSAASTAPPVPSAEAFATAPTSAASHAEGSLPSCRPEVGSWRGDAFPDVWLAKPASTTFRIKFVEVAKGHTISKSFVKALIEQGIGKEFVDDMSVHVLTVIENISLTFT